MPADGDPFLTEMCAQCLSGDPAARPSFPDILERLEHELGPPGTSVFTTSFADANLNGLGHGASGHSHAGSEEGSSQRRASNQASSVAASARAGQGGASAAEQQQQQPRAPPSLSASPLSKPQRPRAVSEPTWSPQNSQQLPSAAISAASAEPGGTAAGAYRSPFERASSLKEQQPSDRPAHRRSHSEERVSPSHSSPDKVLPHWKGPEPQQHSRFATGGEVDTQQIWRSGSADFAAGYMRGSTDGYGQGESPAGAPLFSGRAGCIKA